MKTFNLLYTFCAAAALSFTACDDSSEYGSCSVKGEDEIYLGQSGISWVAEWTGPDELNPKVSLTWYINGEEYDNNRLKIKIYPKESGTYKAKLKIGGDITIKCEDKIKVKEPPKLKIETEKKAVDLGLPSGTKWANMNVGAKDNSAFGDHFAWGSVKPENGPGKINMDISGNVEYDAAMANWGDKWKMPTENQLKELGSNCTWIRKTFNDIDGYQVIGPNGKSIFLPAAGSGKDGCGENFCGLLIGYYWSSTPARYVGNNALKVYVNSDKPNAKYDSERASYLWLGTTEGFPNAFGADYHKYQKSVRPVLAE